MMITQPKPNLKTETWVDGSWEDYLKTLESIPAEQGKSYSNSRIYKVQ